MKEPFCNLGCRACDEEIEAFYEPPAYEDDEAALDREEEPEEVEDEAPHA